MGTLGQVFGMVPQVHLGTVENILQRSQRQINIGVVEMAYGQGKQVYQ